MIAKSSIPASLFDWPQVETDTAQLICCDCRTVTMLAGLASDVGLVEVIGIVGCCHLARFAAEYGFVLDGRNAGSVEESGL